MRGPAKSTALYLTLIPFFFCFFSCGGNRNLAFAGKVDRIVVIKSTHTMMLMSHGQVLKTYKVALGRGGNAAKVEAGDDKTPEGDYVIDGKNPHSRFYRALHVSYPNAQDLEQARKLGVNPGGQIEIHGMEGKWAWVGPLQRYVDWTSGCIAVTNPEIDEIYRLVRVGTPVEILARPKKG